MTTYQYLSDGKLTEDISEVTRSVQVKLERTFEDGMVKIYQVGRNIRIDIIPKGD